MSTSAIAIAADADDSLALSLIATLTLHDIEDLKAIDKGKRSASAPITDEELALQLYELEASSLLTETQDSVFARSIDSALASDVELLGELVQADATARADREMAIALSEGRPPPARASTPRLLVGTSVSTADSSGTALPLTKRPSAGPSSTSGVLAIMQEFCDPLPLSNVSSLRKASSSPSNTALVKKKREVCVICTDTIRGPGIRAPCGHFYDINCLTDLFRSATLDESLFPPRCCQQPFQLSEVRQYFTSQVVRAFEEKSMEFGTANRLYCYIPTCSAFLGSSTENPTSLVCSKCRAQTCGRCREAGHGTRPCTTSTGDDDISFLALAEQEGWKRCPSCRHMVELAYGCYHMTCRCRKEFCYICLETWKNCSCPQWDEGLLLTAARTQVQRQLPAVRPPAAQLQEMVREAANRLRHDHECRHNWQYRSGGGQCEQCYYNLPMYLLRCRSCEMHVCVRCSRNRM